MSVRNVPIVVTWLLVAGCLEKPADVDYDADPRDATPLDAALACLPDSIACDDGLYVECDSQGVAAVVLNCPLGCSSNSEKCLDVDPSNELASYLDLATTDDVLDLVIPGTATLDTDSGALIVDGVTTTISTTPADGVRVVMAKQLTISGTLKVSGTLPLAFVAAGPVTITGLVDVSADGNTAGPGAVVATACAGGEEVSATNPTGGGGGGGRYEAGGTGGTAGNGNAGGIAGAMFADVAIEPLVGGCAGGLSREVNQVNRALGGAGGGALQITSRVSITVSGAGQIDASGGGGQAHNGVGGGGGGSGGGVLLEAPVVVASGVAVVISTKGGAGASAGNDAGSNVGSDGGVGLGAAQGGTATGLPAGGNGGTETTAPTAPGNGTTATMDAGGGGGSVGLARFNTTDSKFEPADGAQIRSRFTRGPLGVREVP